VATEALPRFREVLHEQREFRLEQLADLAGAQRGDDSFSEVAESLLEGARFALSEIDAALDRMDAGRYGLCVECGRPIPVERLEVIPMTAYCMPCQVEVEIRRGVR
jgi:RNA polymerase-binding transcription factor DksA